MASVRYMVRDAAAARDFYVDLLGFTVVEEHLPAIAIVRRGDLILWLAGPPSSAGRAMPDGRVSEPGGWNRIVVEVEDIDGTVTRLRTAGAKFRNDIVKGPGGSQILVEDPSGNAVELFQPRGG
ncbi:hypothetical protein BAL199_03224 [alpha proteobacterium BAL199]|jgi:catechol 2,3-dioxygenase-like lactoylglutathione lyase family enzyme|nr:hypothetical protein BAL199_03224 [alpha proteobacterium BAL199]